MAHSLNGKPTLWQSIASDVISSFSPEVDRLGRVQFRSIDAPNLSTANNQPCSTGTIQQAAPGSGSVPAPRPQVATPMIDTGRRSWQALYLWEGEVEEVAAEGFRARLMPYEEGRANAGRLEFTEFEFEDVSDEDDLALITAGAVFYWSVGRARNPAGTKQNAALLRFRRLPRPSARLRQLAAEEADALLRELGEAT